MALNDTAHDDVADMWLVIAASSAGTVFEWYDFFIYGTLGPILSKAFFPAGNATLSALLFWLVFAVGFGFRPVGAVLFGYRGDRLGRKNTFLITVLLMGVATAGVGLVPSAAQIGLSAPAIVIALRVLQGLALGGEYGGAAVYVAEHAPDMVQLCVQLHGGIGVTAEYPIAHYAARLTAIDQTFGSAGDQLRYLSGRVGDYGVATL